MTESLSVCKWIYDTSRYLWWRRVIW